MNVRLLNQAFYPDVASTAQHAGDLALDLASHGHEVTALAGRRAYDHPVSLFPATENWQGIRILRIRSSGFGKIAKWRRAADSATFLVACLARLLTLERFEVTVAMTTPPLLSVVAALVTSLRGGGLVVWVMDLNPDEAIAAGWLKEASVPARLLGGLLRWSLRRAEKVVVLDRFMKGRVQGKLDVHHGGTEDTEKVMVIPPWTHDGAVRYDPEGREAFRAERGLTGKFVVMYSGNHSPCHPLDTLLAAAERLHRRGAEIVFCFVGGGSEFPKVKRFAEERGLMNVVCVPYQPLEKLSASLSAADLHIVVMGDPFVGIVHPCKIYNVLRLGIPFLYIGPPESHVTDIVAQYRGTSGTENWWARLARHGDVDAVVRHILDSAAAGPRRSEEQVQLARQFSQEVLLPKMVNVIERAATA